MDDLSRIAGSAAGPLYLAVLMAAIALARVMPAIMERLNERRRDTASEKAADWTRLRNEVERYSDRIQRLEASEERCRRELAEAVGRIAQLEGWQAGQGDVRQAAALAAAEVRRAERKDKGE